MLVTSLNVLVNSTPHVSVMCVYELQHDRNVKSTSIELHTNSIKSFLLSLNYYDFHVFPSFN